ncbi:UbiA family prenyltransferase [Roseivirga misakiensis]|uniref:Ubiquinone biosynthesis protein UbiA n=1 Tax=Roseivirga misakiensis TaxID=1563681 RepID=A0A1E5T6Q4_9BACT|nr:UbiA family prenyltransferase [Roseivirga misakiensis]OEK07062.1 ubiquinone biosynthesis protein UbiA [Roseivirga misakiensis]
MFKKSNWLHLRIHFSYFLLPIYLFALSISPNLSEESLIWTFLILHLFIYPASNAFNSYFDKDEKSIGGLKNPPPVDKNLFYLSQLFDLLGLALCLYFFPGNYTLLIMLIAYILASRAYSHPWVRLKKYAVISWLIAGFFQGAWVVWLVFIGLNDFSFTQIFKPHVVIPGLLASAILWGSYPMTQIYQHEEDAKRGDITMSIKLGLKGTFMFTGVFFGLASLGYFFYFKSYFDIKYSIIFIGAMLPVVTYFTWWFLKTLKDDSQANYTNTMRLNWISASCLGAFFLYLFLDSSHVLSVAGVY